MTSSEIVRRGTYVTPYYLTILSAVRIFRFYCVAIVHAITLLLLSERYIGINADISIHSDL